MRKRVRDSRLRIASPIVVQTERADRHSGLPTPGAREPTPLKRALVAERQPAHQKAQPDNRQSSNRYGYQTHVDVATFQQPILYSAGR